MFREQKVKPIFAATTASLALIAASPALAQDASAETGDPDGATDNRTIVVTGALTDFGATKSDTPIVETARSISISSRQDCISTAKTSAIDSRENEASPLSGPPAGVSFASVLEATTPAPSISPTQVGAERLPLADSRFMNWP